MPVNNPQPPHGYQIVQKSPAAAGVNGKGDDSFTAPDYSDVPAFIKSGIDLSKVRQTPTSIYGQDPDAIASVTPANPYKIDVDMPDLYGPPVLNHELTHTFQFTRNQSLPAPNNPNDGGSASPKSYAYGGVEGLEKALRGGKTIADFNVEQQADMVRDYKARYGGLLHKAQHGRATPQDLHEMYRLRQAYHPFIQQLADMPGQGQPVAMPTGKPAAPGLPDYSVAGLGVVPADPLMGGNSVYPTEVHRTGETKRFVNGKIGRWDGHGWRAD